MDAKYDPSPMRASLGVWATPPTRPKVYTAPFLALHDAYLRRYPDLRIFFPEMSYETLELGLLQRFGGDIGYGGVVNLPKRQALSSEATTAALLLPDGLPKGKVRSTDFLVENLPTHQARHVLAQGAA